MDVFFLSFFFFLFEVLDLKFQRCFYNYKIYGVFKRRYDTIDLIFLFSFGVACLVHLCSAMSVGFLEFENFSLTFLKYFWHI